MDKKKVILSAGVIAVASLTSITSMNAEEVEPISITDNGNAAENSLILDSQLVDFSELEKTELDFLNENLLKISAIFDRYITYNESQVPIVQGIITENIDGTIVQLYNNGDDVMINIDGVTTYYIQHSVSYSYDAIVVPYSSD